MKKFLTILVALVTFTGVADAQISIKKSDVGKPKQMITLSSYWSWIYQADDSYFIVMKSDNEFDDYFWLKLGYNKDDCLKSIASLQEMMDDMGETDRYDVDNGEGKTFSVTMTKEFGIKKMIFHGENYAGAGYLFASNFAKANKWIQKNLK